MSEERPAYRTATQHNDASGAGAHEFQAGSGPQPLDSREQRPEGDREAALLRSIGEDAVADAFLDAVERRP